MRRFDNGMLSFVYKKIIEACAHKQKAAEAAWKADPRRMKR